MQKKIKKRFSVFDITASELVPLNFSFKKRIHVIGTQYVNKHSADFPYH